MAYITETNTVSRCFIIMNGIGIIIVCIAGLLIFDANARGDGSLRTYNPYGTIATRNVFGLQPPTVIPPALTPQVVSKITLTGITTILGPPAILFKVTRQSSSEKVTGNTTYLLKEGEMQDGIEVTRVRAGIDTLIITAPCNRSGSKQRTINPEPCREDFANTLLFNASLNPKGIKYSAGRFLHLQVWPTVAPAVDATRRSWRRGLVLPNNNKSPVTADPASRLPIPFYFAVTMASLIVLTTQNKFRAESPQCDSPAWRAGCNVSTQF